MTDKELANKFNQHVALLVKRPGMFRKETILENFEIYLKTYLLLILGTHEVNLLSSWQYWIAIKFNLWSPVWRRGNAIKKSMQSDKEAISILPISLLPSLPMNVFTPD